MPRTAASLVSEALAAWILSRLEDENDFAREGLPEFDIPRLLQALSAGGLPAEGFSLALVGFDTTEEELRATADAHGLGELAGVTIDLHVATEWRNDRERHPRIVALARGYNPSVHGLRFFSRASSGELAGILLGWAETAIRVHDDAAASSAARDAARGAGAEVDPVPGRRRGLSRRMERGQATGR